MSNDPWLKIDHGEVRRPAAGGRGRHRLRELAGASILKKYLVS
jgi:hypothetical protein